MNEDDFRGDDQYEPMPEPAPRLLEYAVAQGDYKTKPPPVKFTLPGLVRGTLGLVVAPGGVGKSMTMLTLAHEAAVPNLNITGIFGTLPRQPLKTLYVTAEDPVDVVESRKYAIAQVANMDDEQIEFARYALRMVSFAGYRPCHLVKNGEFHQLGIDTMMHLIRDFNPDLVVLDTLRKFFDGEENSSSTATLVTQALDMIAREVDASVVAVHHANKAAQMSNGEVMAAASRGSSAFTDNVRWQVNLIPCDEFADAAKETSTATHLLWAQSKVNFAKARAPVHMEKAQWGIPVACETKEKTS